MARVDMKGHMGDVGIGESSHSKKKIKRGIDIDRRVCDDAKHE